MAIEEIDKSLDVVDSIFTKTSRILKKHWLLLLFILVCLFIYWAVTSEDDYYYEDEFENEIWNEQIN